MRIHNNMIMNCVNKMLSCLVCFCLMGSLVSCDQFDFGKISIETLNIDSQPTDHETSFSDGCSETVTGEKDPNVSGKPLPNQQIGFRCPAFIRPGEKLSMDLVVGDYSYDYHQKFGGEPSYDTYGKNGYPNLRIFSRDSDGKETDDNRLNINGKEGKFQKIYTKEDMKLIGLSPYDSLGQGKHEPIEIDFSNFEVGDSGIIEFIFAWDFGEVPDAKDSNYYNWNGMGQVLTFYKGEKGIAFVPCSYLEEIEHFYWVHNEDIDGTPEIVLIPDSSK